MLDLQMLSTMSPETIFATGIIDNSPEGIFMTRSGGKLRWLAIKGRANDWCIYIHWESSTAEYVKRAGDKVCDKKHIRKLVPCSNEAFKAYRY